MAGGEVQLVDLVKRFGDFTAVDGINVTVSAGVTIAPGSPSTPPLGTITFTATNGSGTGYTWALVTFSSVTSSNPAFKKAAFGMI